MAKTLIVGAGFLGKYVINELLSYPENEVVALDLVVPDTFFNTPYMQNHSKNPNLRYYWKSAGDIQSLFKELPNVDDINFFDCICYTSAIADVPFALKNPKATVNTNVVQTTDFLEYLRVNDFDGRLIMMSSESVYGHQPVQEETLAKIQDPKTGHVQEIKRMKGIKEDALPCPKDIYGATKLSQEQIALSYYRAYKIKTVVVRSATMFGPYSRVKQVMPIFIQQALEGRNITVDGDGSGSRDFNYVLNTVLAIKNLVNNETLKGQIDGEIFNVGSGEETRLKNLAMAIIKLSNSVSQIKYRDWREGEEGLRVCLDISKARERLGYEPLVKTIDGIKNTIRWVASDVCSFGMEEMEELDRTLGIIKKSTKVGDTNTTISENPVQ